MRKEAIDLSYLLFRHYTKPDRCCHFRYDKAFTPRNDGTVRGLCAVRPTDKSKEHKMNKLEFHPSSLKKLAVLFVAAFCIAFSIFSMSRSSATSSSSLPTSGSCAMLLTLPIPYGVSIGPGGYQTGYNIIGLMTFTSATSATASLRIVNPSFQSSDSPYIDQNDIVDLQNLAVTISPMTANNGFVGGYVFTASGTLNGNPVGFQMVGVPSNNGKTIMFVSTTPGTSGSPGLGPFSGVCQV